MRRWFDFDRDRAYGVLRTIAVAVGVCFFSPQLVQAGLIVLGTPLDDACGETELRIFWNYEVVRKGLNTSEVGANESTSASHSPVQPDVVVNDSSGASSSVDGEGGLVHWNVATFVRSEFLPGDELAGALLVLQESALPFPWLESLLDPPREC